MTSTACLKDTDDIDKVNDMLSTELSQILIPQRRSKRALALVAAGLLGTDMLVGSITGQSAASNFGQGLAHAFGFSTWQDLQMTKQELEKHAQALHNLSLNQQELLAAQMSLTRDILTVKSLIDNVENNIAIMYGEIDLKLTSIAFKISCNKQ